jgi:hypothetical protein
MMAFAADEQAVEIVFTNSFIPNSSAICSLVVPLG